MKERTAAKKARLFKIADRLRTLYQNAECALRYGGDPFRLLVMGRLSAQCTDARVNAIAPALFARYPTAHAMAEAEEEELMGLIRSCGLYRTKARDLIGASRMLCTRYGGRVPDTMEALLLLPGVGRKIANLLLGDLYGKGGVVADTHCIRIAARLGFTREGDKSPLRCERALTPLLLSIGVDPSDFCHRIVLFGREVCTARAPLCTSCPLSDLCPKHKEKTHG